MGWAERRVQEYKNGERATFVEKRFLEHANPVHLLLAVVGVIALVYGLWMHDLTWIIGGAFLNIVGHIYCWVQK